MTIDGRVVYEKKQTITLPKNTAIDVITLPVQDILGSEQPENVFFYITFETSPSLGERLRVGEQGSGMGAGVGSYYNIAYPLRQKDMAYKKPNLSVTCSSVPDGFAVRISTDLFARAVYLKTKGISDFFSDNYFDLLPGQSRTIHVRTSKPLQQFQQELEITTLGDDY